MYVKFSHRFTKQYDRVEPKLRTVFQGRLALFMEDPFNPVLNNHSLKGKYRGYQSINVTGDWRALYFDGSVEGGAKVVVFAVLGTHSQLYK